MSYYLLPKNPFLIHKYIDYIDDDKLPSAVISNSLSTYLSEIKQKIDKREKDWDIFKKYTNPYEYNPNLPSREYIYFLYSRYPIPVHYATIAEETPDKIFLQGEHSAFSSESGKYETYSAVLNKQTMLIEWTNLNYKNEITKFKSQCSKTRE